MLFNGDTRFHHLRKLRTNVKHEQTGETTFPLEAESLILYGICHKLTYAQHDTNCTNAYLTDLLCSDRILIK